ncbi:unnamed protein product, partial [Thlaspi arvense]
MKVPYWMTKKELAEQLKFDVYKNRRELEKFELEWFLAGERWASCITITEAALALWKNLFKMALRIGKRKVVALFKVCCRRSACLSLMFAPISFINWTWVQGDETAGSSEDDLSAGEMPEYLGVTRKLTRLLLLNQLALTRKNKQLVHKPAETSLETFRYHAICRNGQFLWPILLIIE